ncbi:MFS general substrate transporter [Macrolepiota fuliginosa MF-IS2]|uniref:MFS general substrate transporter n=1 Tax=Macrolepiota fuliginosa MF-IS2 TaxID=1400762 RepID=A0A9P5X8R4_9AGAR|nr:MFS general substrate transporter [Macrolepiota fuliginosa MF-IS2]
MPSLRDIWDAYSPIERRNMGIYIGGIMFYKLGLEFFNGSITTLATDRFKASNTFSKLGAAQGVNQAAQCVGAILIAPLIKRWPTRTVLSGAIILFCFMVLILLIVDAATGGKMKPPGATAPIYGHWDANLIFLVWTLAGIAYGMVELIRRVIPADIVGGNVGKLRRMDALVHVLYEVAGTAGAIGSSSAISRWGNNYSFFLSPVFFAFAAGTWILISSFSESSRHRNQAALSDVDNGGRKNNYLVQITRGARGFAESIWVGAVLVLTNRRFIWLLPSYALALYLHRFLETTLAPAFAKRVLGISAWSQIIVGGSNFGELIGALSVFFLSDMVTTPLPWLRLDALNLNLVWLLPYLSSRASPNVSWAWRLAGLFAPISMGWAAGDVSLAAYIQSALSESQISHKNVSTLGAVMAFLYSTYIVLDAVLSTLLGRVIDNDWVNHNNIKSSLTHVGGIQFSVCCGIILISSLIPLGALALNPKDIGSINLLHMDDVEEESVEDMYPKFERQKMEDLNLKLERQGSEDPDFAFERQGTEDVNFRYGRQRRDFEPRY